MRSYQIVAFGQPLEERTYENPNPQGAEVLVRVRGCGVCHSDLHISSGYFDLGDAGRINVGERGVVLPFTLGHEIVGEVLAFGPEAEGVRVGDRRVAFPWIGCGTCEVCREGRENLCVEPRFLGTRRAGGYSDHVLVPHPRYLLDYSGIDEDFAAVAACSGVTTFSAIKKAGALGPKDRLLLIGAGGLGLMAMRLASAMTEARQIVADVDETKLAAARQAGAGAVVNPAREDAIQQVLEASGGGVVAAIDLVGSGQSAAFGLACLRRGGTLVVVGLYGGTLSLAMPLLPLRNVSIQGSYVGTLDEMSELLDLLRSGSVAPVPIARRPLEEANSALDDLRAGRIVGRTILRP